MNDQEIIIKAQNIVAKAATANNYEVKCDDCGLNLDDSISGVYTHLKKVCRGGIITCNVCGAQLDRKSFEIHFSAHQIEFYATTILSIQQIGSFDMQERFFDIATELRNLAASFADQAEKKLNSQMEFEKENIVPEFQVPVIASQNSECVIVESSPDKRKRLKKVDKRRRIVEEVDETQLYTQPISLIQLPM
jgi:hypothetical protein